MNRAALRKTISHEEKGDPVPELRFPARPAMAPQQLGQTERSRVPDLLPAASLFPALQAHHAGSFFAIAGIFHRHDGLSRRRYRCRSLGGRLDRSLYGGQRRALLRETSET